MGTETTETQAPPAQPTLAEWAEAQGIDPVILRTLLRQHGWSSVATDFDQAAVLSEVERLVALPHGYGAPIPLHAEQSPDGTPPLRGTYRRAGRPDTLRGRRAAPTARGGRR